MKEFLIRDGQGTVFNKVIRPTVVMDTELGIMLKIGEYNDMMDYFDTTSNSYRKIGFHQYADELALMELPKNQEEIDKVFQITNYVAELYKKAI